MFPAEFTLATWIHKHAQSKSVGSIIIAFCWIYLLRTLRSKHGQPHAKAQRWRRQPEQQCIVPTLCVFLNGLSVFDHNGNVLRLLVFASKDSCSSNVRYIINQVIHNKSQTRCHGNDVVSQSPIARAWLPPLRFTAATASFQKSANDTRWQNKACKLGFVTLPYHTELETLQQHIHHLVNEMFMAGFKGNIYNNIHYREMILSSNGCKPQLLLLQGRLRFPDWWTIWDATVVQNKQTRALTHDVLFPSISRHLIPTTILTKWIRFETNWSRTISFNDKGC